MAITHTTISQATKPLKRATNLSLSADTLAEAKALGINVSQACDAFLRDLVRQEKSRRWKLEHAEYIDAYNRSVADEGLPLQEWRTF